MAFELRDRDLLGRIGRLTTMGGEVETPAFMPVINPISQVISPRRMKEEFGCDIVITNSYIIRKNFGEKTDLDVHRILDYDGVVATDSGAYQILVYGGVEVTQDEIIDFQKRIGSDIAIILDIPTGWDVPRERVEWTVEETLRRARDALPLIEGSRALWVGPVQGGRHLDLVARSAKLVGDMSFHIHALGSPTEVMERYLFPVLVDMIMAAKLNLPPERPLHLFGAGHPMMFSLAVALGCDLFDSASYALYAKDDRYLTTMGTSRMEDLSYLPCSCPVCHGRSVEDLKEMTKGERERLLAEHNLHACMTEINTIKQAIVEGSLWDLVERRSRGHPSMTAALKRLTNYKDAIEEGTPLFKGHGVFYYDYHSLSRPEVTRYHRLLEANYSPPAGADTLLLVKAPNTRPYRADPAYRGLRKTLSTELGEAFDGLHICFYAPPYGCIPEDLSETYPLSQYDIAEPVDEETIEFTAQSVARHIGLGGFNRIVLHQGVERLDMLVAEASREACKKLGTIMEASGSTHPWGEEAMRSLLALLSRPASLQ